MSSVVSQRMFGRAACDRRSGAATVAPAAPWMKARRGSFDKFGMNLLVEAAEARDIRSTVLAEGRRGHRVLHLHGRQWAAAFPMVRWPFRSGRTLYFRRAMSAQTKVSGCHRNGRRADPQTRNFPFRAGAPPHRPAIRRTNFPGLRAEFLSRDSTWSGESPGRATYPSPGICP